MHAYPHATGARSDPPSKTNSLNSSSENCNSISSISTTQVQTHNIQTSQKIVRVWVGSWNMAAKDIAESQISHIPKFVPAQSNPQSTHSTTNSSFPNYDIYIFGTQECISDTIYDSLENHLQKHKISRFHTVSPKVEGRGDGSFLKQKHTGIALYVANSLKPHVAVLRSAACSLGMTEGSKGAACFSLRVYDQTLAAICVHMSSKSVLDRRACFCTLVEQCGVALGEDGFGLLEQFHHVIWFGDTNMRLNKQQTNAASVLKMLTEHKMHELQVFDEMHQEIQQNQAFNTFSEGEIQFLPTYKKRPDRIIPLDTQSDKLSWVTRLYNAYHKQPWYKGGEVVERIPSWCDRILWRSLDSYKDAFGIECRYDMIAKEEKPVYNSFDDILSTSDHTAVSAGFVWKFNLANQMPVTTATSTSNSIENKLLSPLYVDEQLRQPLQNCQKFENSEPLRPPLQTSQNSQTQHHRNLSSSSKGSDDYSKILVPVESISTRIYQVRVLWCRIIPFRTSVGRLSHSLSLTQSSEPRAMRAMFPLPFEDHPSHAPNSKLLNFGDNLSNYKNETQGKRATPLNFAALDALTKHIQSTPKSANNLTKNQIQQVPQISKTQITQQKPPTPSSVPVPGAPLSDSSGDEDEVDWLTALNELKNLEPSKMKTAPSSPAKSTVMKQNLPPLPVLPTSVAALQPLMELECHTYSSSTSKRVKNAEGNNTHIHKELNYQRDVQQFHLLIKVVSASDQTSQFAHKLTLSDFESNEKIELIENGTMRGLPQTQFSVHLIVEPRTFITTR